MKWMFKKLPRRITILLAVGLCMVCFSTVVFADGGDYYDDELPPNETEQVKETTPEPTSEPTTTESTAEPTTESAVAPTTVPTIEPGTPFTEDGIAVTRDLLYDKQTNKQFITVETRNGHTLYIIIDYDKLLDEKEERYQTYFLNPVDEADLLALLEDGQTVPATCTCTEKCTAGHVNTNCPVCKTDMTNCMGKEAQTTEPEPTASPDETEQQKPGSLGGILAVLLVLAIGCGVGIWYFKFRKQKASGKGGGDLDEFDFDEDDEDGADEYERESDVPNLFDEEDDE